MAAGTRTPQDLLKALSGDEALDAEDELRERLHSEDERIAESVLQAVIGGLKTEAAEQCANLLVADASFWRPQNAEDALVGALLAAKDATGLQEIETYGEIAAHACTDFPDLSARLDALLTQPQPEVRAVAAYAFGKVRAPSDLGLLPLLQDKDELVRQTALEAAIVLARDEASLWLPAIAPFLEKAQVDRRHVVLSGLNSVLSAAFVPAAKPTAPMPPPAPSKPEGKPALKPGEVSTGKGTPLKLESKSGQQAAFAPEPSVPKGTPLKVESKSGQQPAFVPEPSAPKGTPLKVESKSGQQAAFVPEPSAPKGTPLKVESKSGQQPAFKPEAKSGPQKTGTGTQPAFKPLTAGLDTGSSPKLRPFNQSGFDSTGDTGSNPKLRPFAGGGEVSGSGAALGSFRIQAGTGTQPALKKLADEPGTGSSPALQREGKTAQQYAFKPPEPLQPAPSAPRAQLRLEDKTATQLTQAALAALKDDDLGTRVEAVAMLGLLGTPAAKAALEKSLEAPEVMVACEAATALLRAGTNAKALARLRAAVDADADSADAALTALEGLDPEGLERAASVLEHLKKHPDAAFREAAALLTF